MILNDNELSKLREKISYVHADLSGYATCILIDDQRYYLRASKKARMFGSDEYYAELEVDGLDTIVIENPEDAYKFLYQVEGQIKYEHIDKEVDTLFAKVGIFKESLK